MWIKVDIYMYQTCHSVAKKAMVPQLPAILGTMPQASSNEAPETKYMYRIGLVGDVRLALVSCSLLPHPTKFIYHIIE
jgi:hypothetical protein